MAGFSYLANNSTSHAVRWTGTTAADLGTLGGVNSVAFCINDSGTVAGYSNPKNSTYSHAVRWTGAAAVDLGTLGGNNSYADGINSAGDVVGESLLLNGSDVGFLYTKGHMIDLNSLLPMGSGWTLTQAYAINDNGWITGTGTVNGHTHAFLLKPNAAPEPSALAVLGVGCWVLGVGVKRRRQSKARRASGFGKRK